MGSGIRWKGKDTKLYTLPVGKLYGLPGGTRRYHEIFKALILAEMYSFTGMFMSMSSTLRACYPITAIMGVPGYYETATGNLIASTIILLLCGCLSILILIVSNHKEREMNGEKMYINQHGKTFFHYQPLHNG